MKKTKNQLLRMQTIIDNDRMSICNNFNDIILSDIKKLLSDYFDFTEAPFLEIIKDGDVYKINISLSAFRIKSFGKIV